MKREYQETSYSSDRIDCPPLPAPMMNPGNKKMLIMGEEDHESCSAAQDAGVDEQLAALGYKVRASDMADVAQKLEQLEMVMGSAQEDGLLSHLATDTVHYNPSDIATWLESMLSEVTPPPSSPPPPTIAAAGSSVLDSESSTITTVDYPKVRIYDPGCGDLSVIPGDVVYGIGAGDSDPFASREKKRIKSAATPETVESSSAARAVVMVDTQEAGIRLVHTLMACAETVQQDNLTAAEALVKQISVLAASQAGAMRKVATYFAEALARRIYRLYPTPKESLDSSLSDMLEMHFYETCPYLKFAHFTANQAILEAFAGHNRVHVIDFGMKQGMQWPALMQALALRPGGPPAFRLTGIGPPQPDNTDALQQVGWKLAQLAETVRVEFEYRGLVAESLADLEPYMLEVRPETEAVAVNSVFELHRLLARPGAVEKVLAAVKAVRPRIVTVVEQEANHNDPVFLDRFTEALHYYSTVFDSLEGGTATPPAGSQDQVMSEVYLGRQICNVVACEGAERVERHETLRQWRARMERAGFSPVQLGSNAFKQASMLLALFAGGDGYRVEENNGCLMLGWHTRPLIATSAWYIPHPVALSSSPPPPPPLR